MYTQAQDLFMEKLASQKEKQFLERIVAMATGIGQGSKSSAAEILAQFPAGSAKHSKAQQILRNLGKGEEFIASKPTALSARILKEDARVPGSEFVGNVQVRTALARNAERIERGQGLRMPRNSKASRANSGTILPTPKKLKFLSNETHKMRSEAHVPESRRGLPRNNQYATRGINSDYALAKRIDNRQGAEAVQLGKPRPAPIRVRLLNPPQDPPHRAKPPVVTRSERTPGQSAPATKVELPDVPSPAKNSMRSKLLAGAGIAALGASSLGVHSKMRAAAATRRRMMGLGIGGGGAGLAGLAGLLASSRDK